MWSDEPFSVSRKILINQTLIRIGGESGIRTHGRLAPTAVFKTAALNHSAISPIFLHGRRALRAATAV